MDATTQAAGQVLVNAVLDLMAMPLVFGIGGGRHWLSSAPLESRRRLAMAACWNGVLVVGATTWAMSFAQQAFPASTAALAYAMEPLFAAVFAAIVLHEDLGLLQLAGGCLIVAANVLVGMRAAAGEL